MKEQFDLTSEFHAEIEPKLKELHLLCIKHVMPMTFHVCFKSDGRGGYQALSAGALKEERTPITFQIAADLIRADLPGEALSKIMEIIEEFNGKECDCEDCKAARDHLVC